MNYEGQICRAPMERGAFMLPIMVGCSYNGCKFCNLFRHLKYRKLPVEQIEAELQRVKECGGNPKRIFLGDGNAFDLPMGELSAILRLVKSYFPQCEMINMDATVTGILKKTGEELKELYELGARHLYLGIETGLDDVLSFMNKDHTLEEAYEAIRRLQEAGLIFDAHIMTGVAGKGRGEENALALAEFLNKTHPAHVVNFSMFLHKEVPLYREAERGAFTQADELECLKEELSLIERAGTEESPISYDGFHDFIEFRVRGILPRDREKMEEKLQAEIRKYEGRRPVYSLVYGECPNIIRCEGDERIY